MIRIRQSQSSEVVHRFAKTIFAVGVGLSLVVPSPDTAQAKSDERPLLRQLGPSDSQQRFDAPPAAMRAQQRFAPGDTITFGYVDANGFAVEGEVWTFDHGHSDPLEGWYAEDLTENQEAYFRHITVAIWDADPNNAVAAPVLSGDGSAWCGVFGSEANDLCWESGLGYGNRFCQRLISPAFSHDGSSSVGLDWLHFNDTEEDFDYTNVYLKTLPSDTETLIREYTGQVGLAGDHPLSPPTGVFDSETLMAVDFGGESDYHIVFEMTSDGGWSDSDALSPTEYGPCAFDDVNIDGANFDFESDLDGWTAEACPGFGTYIGVNDLSNYSLEDLCNCNLSGNVLGFHDENQEHPYGQRTYARSAPVDLANATDPNGPGQLEIAAHWSQYSDLPTANGVFYRPGWTYFPFTCPVTGEQGWSGRVGQVSTYFFEPEGCFENRTFATIGDNPVPRDAEQVRFLYEVYASCDAFQIPEDVCTEETNATPLIDNITIFTTRIADAPQVFFDNGLRYQDGFAQGTEVNLPDFPGNADVTRNRSFGNIEPIILGDSVYVAGPLAGSDPATQWEAKLWFQIERVGPAADSRYTTWRDRVRDGNNIDPDLAGAGPVEWTFAFMDSFEVGTNVANNKFLSYFREDDDDFDGGSGDLTEPQEIIADGVLFPGTQVNYFVSSNFIGNPQRYLLPDTAGGFSLEFEILPSWRDDGGVLKYPALLYIDAFNAGAEFFIESAFDALGIEADRYDYLDSTSSWKAPMARGNSSGSNNGCTLFQLLGYRGILLNSGSFNVSSQMWPSDYVLFSDWLTAEICDAETGRQGLILNGNGVANALNANGGAILSQLGVTHVANRYSTFSGDLNDCVRVESPAGGGEDFGTSNSLGDYEYDVYGNWCPIQYSFDVLGVTNSGVGNRVYLNASDLETEVPFAQVTNEFANNRTIVDGTSYHNLSDVDPIQECVSDSAHIVTAAANEILAALEWIYGVGQVPGLIEDPCEGVVADAPWTAPSGITRMYASTPNPYNQRTTVRFSLAQSGQAQVAIYDAAGRRVRTIVDGELDAGAHELVWDGTDDAGRSLPAGVYWARLDDGVQESSSKLVSLR